MRRGGPWNKELELYYSLLEEREISPLEEKEVVLHQAQVDVKADTVSITLAVSKYSGGI